MKRNKKLWIAGIGICAVLIAGPQLASAGWGNVFDPSRFAKNTAVYTEKAKEYGLQSKMYANMILALARLAGIDDAENKTLTAIKDYSESTHLPFAIDQWDSQIDKLDEEFNKMIMLDGSSGCFGPKAESIVAGEIMKDNADALDKIAEQEQSRSKLEKTIGVILKMKADGTLGEIQKGNYLDGLTVSEKIGKLNQDIQKYEKYAKELNMKQYKETIDQIHMQQMTYMPAHDPYHPENDARIGGQENIDHYDAFGNKNYKSENLGFPTF